MHVVGHRSQGLQGLATGVYRLPWRGEMLQITHWLGLISKVYLGNKVGACVLHGPGSEKCRQQGFSCSFEFDHPLLRRAEDTPLCIGIAFLRMKTSAVGFIPQKTKRPSHRYIRRIHFQLHCLVLLSTIESTTVLE
jgi:hypothetical protein